MVESPEITLANEPEVKALFEHIAMRTERGTVVIFTNGNAWYVPTLIHNLIQTADHHEPTAKIGIFVTDSEGAQYAARLNLPNVARAEISALGVENHLADTNSETRKYVALTLVKTVLVKLALDCGYIPFYIDPDMAFKTPAIENLLSYLEKAPIVLAGSREYINTNIIIARPTDEIRRIFRLTEADFQNILAHWNSDEDLVRPRLSDEMYVCINVHDYPPGCDAVQFKERARMIHANCVSGLENKIGLIKDCDAWLGDCECPLHPWKKLG